MDRTELAWAAGFWDGEGWVNLVRFGRGDLLRPMGQINQAGADGIPEVLLRFRRAVGVGRIEGPEITEGKQPLYRWIVSSRADVTEIVDLLEPWLSDVKRAQFDALVAPQRARGAFGLMPVEEQKAWVAGLWDGEGSLCLLKHRSHRGHFVPEASVTQSSDSGRPEVLQRLFSVAGSGYWYGPFQQEGANLAVYRWKLFRLAEIRAFMDLIWPWLGPVKKAQADNVISVLLAQPALPRGNPAWGSYKTHCLRGHEYQSARLRPFRGRGKNSQPRRASKQCLVCVRDDARRRRSEKKQNGGRGAAVPVAC